MNNILAKSERILYPNELLDDVEETTEAEQAQEALQQALQEQREDIIITGAILTIRQKYSKRLSRNTPKKLEAQITREVETIVAMRMKRLYTYEWWKDILRSIMDKAMNMTGQYELNRRLWTERYKFELTESSIKKKITDRINVLIKQLDSTTKNRMAQAIIKGIKEGKSKEDLVRELMRMSKDISKTRADKILTTEIAAAIWFMRKEYASRVWAGEKTRHTSEDERVCPLCFALNEQTVGIDDSFAWWIEHEPAHPRCRCYVTYDYESYDASEWIREYTKKAYSFYEESEKQTWRCTNKEFVWVGWWYKGKDTSILKYYTWLKENNGLETYRTMDAKLFWYAIQGKTIEDIKEWRRVEVMTTHFGISDTALMIMSARKYLTNEWFVQLMRSLWYRWYFYF